LAYGYGKREFPEKREATVRKKPATKKPRTKKPAIVQKIIASPHPEIPEKAEIAVHGADELYREIRIENTLEDDKGRSGIEAGR
jgi:hypothetical protein